MRALAIATFRLVSSCVPHPELRRHPTTRVITLTMALAALSLSGDVARLRAAGSAGKAPPYSIHTLAGTAPYSLGRPSPEGVAVDSGGTVYATDSINDTIRKIAPDGTVSTLAGSLISGHADGVGAGASFSGPTGIAVDSGGTVYVVDTLNSTIRKITSTGVVTTLAGLAGQTGSVDGAGAAARFTFPRGIAVDGGGTVYVADSLNGTIRTITPAGVVSTLAGLAGSFGSADGVGAAARFSDPEGIAVDDAGTLYVADSGNNVIRTVTPAGVVITLAGMAGSSGSADGTGSAARFSGPSGISVDAAGTIYVGDSFNHTIRRVTPAGVVSTFAGMVGFSGGTNGTGSAARFFNPIGVAVARFGGTVYVADRIDGTPSSNFARSGSVRAITPAGVVSTLPGLDGSTGSADGVGTAARFNGPAGVAVDGAGTIYVADTGNHTIRTITPAGVVSTLAGLAGQSGGTDGTGAAARFNGPAGIAVDLTGTVYVADTGNHTIRRITPSGEVSTPAGLAGAAGSADGSGSVARFSSPRRLVVDSAGTVYVADYGNFTIRTMTPDGVVSTLAGSAGQAGTADGVGAAARFIGPRSIAVDAARNLYVADAPDALSLFSPLTPALRKITSTGVVGTLLESTGFEPLGRFSVAVDNASALYIANAGVTFAAPPKGSLSIDYNTIVVRTAAGRLSTVAGLLRTRGSTDGTGNAARFRNPTDIAVDNTGTVYIADTDNNTIRVGSPAGTPEIPVTTSGDFDGDTRTDIAVFRPGGGHWFVRHSSQDFNIGSSALYQWGLPGDVPISADFDGDKAIDLTVFRPANGTWYIRYSSLGYSIASAGAVQWGLPGDIPIAGDFDGDGKAELTVFRPANGTWYIRYSSLGYSIASSDAFQWGLPGDVPIAGDFDGDHKTELAVFRPVNGTWYIRYSSLAYGIANADAFQWGLPGDVPIAGDFDGDGKTELTVFRPVNGTWYIRYSSLAYSIPSSAVFQWGLPGDEPTAADFDGDGKTDLTVFRPPTGEWFIRYSALGYDISRYAVYQWGLPGDMLVE
jgi:sugar lactone lactonase YvrE